MKTKHFIRFLNRIAHFDADIELVDVLSISTKNGKLSSPSCPHIFDFVDPEKHRRLAARSSSDHNRLLAVAHLKATVYSSFIKDIYEDMVAYFQSILASAAEKGLDPNRLIGEHKVDLQANEILEAGNWQETIRLVTGSVFRKLQNEKQTRNLISKMNTKLDLGVDQKIIDDALPYLELRHILIHRDGIADDRFVREYPSIPATAGKEIKIDFAMVQNAEKAITALIENFDEKLIAKKAIAANEIQR